MSFAVYTDKGLKRKNNEDNFYLDGVYLSAEEMNERAAFSGVSSSGVLAVFDGLGGESYGEIAAYEAAKVLDRYRKAMKSIGGEGRFKALTEMYITEANAAVMKRSYELHSRMGTTLAMLVFSGGKAAVLNMGDSRIYLLRNGTIRCLSYDHTLAEFLVSRGELTPAAAKTDPRRNSLLKYLGGEEGAHDFKPYYSPVIQLESGDRFLLCSDGLTDMVKDNIIAAILGASSNAVTACEELVTAALKAGGNDNVTTLCVFNL